MSSVPFSHTPSKGFQPSATAGPRGRPRKHKVQEVVGACPPSSESGGSPVVAGAPSSPSSGDKHVVRRNSPRVPGWPPGKAAKLHSHVLSSETFPSLGELHKVGITVVGNSLYVSGYGWCPMPSTQHDFRRENLSELLLSFFEDREVQAPSRKKSRGAPMAPPRQIMPTMVSMPLVVEDDASIPDNWDDEVVKAVPEVHRVEERDTHTPVVRSLRAEVVEVAVPEEHIASIGTQPYSNDASGVNTPRKHLEYEAFRRMSRIGDQSNPLHISDRVCVVDVGAGHAGIMRHMNTINASSYPGIAVVHCLCPVRIAYDLIVDPLIPRVDYDDMWGTFRTRNDRVNGCNHSLSECTCIDNLRAEGPVVFYSRHSIYYWTDEDFRKFRSGDRIFVIANEFQGSSGVIDSKQWFRRKDGQIESYAERGCGDRFVSPDVSVELKSGRFRWVSGGRDMAAVGRTICTTGEGMNLYEFVVTDRVDLLFEPELVREASQDVSLASPAPRSDELPEVTQVGRNTYGAYVDRQARNVFLEPDAKKRIKARADAIRNVMSMFPGNGTRDEEKRVSHDIDRAVLLQHEQRLAEINLERLKQPFMAGVSDANDGLSMRPFNEFYWKRSVWVTFLCLVTLSLMLGFDSLSANSTFMFGRLTISSGPMFELVLFVWLAWFLARFTVYIMYRFVDYRLREYLWFITFESVDPFGKQYRLGYQSIAKVPLGMLAVRSG